MKKGLLSLTAFLFALVAVPQAHALVGGPFDNGDYNSLLDDSGVYQAAFRFKNGSGFAQFGMNVDIAPFVDISTTAGTGVRGTTFSILNRSLIYYKGVTYLGTASGIVDHERKRIEGMTNGNSDVRTTSSTTTGGGSQAQSAATSTLINNGGLNFPCNTSWTAKITSSSPILRFSGKGELTVLNPSLDQVAYSAIIAIINNAQSATGGVVLSPGAQIEAVVDAITAAQSADVIPSADSTRDNSDSVKMTVFGSRKFFLTRR